MKVVGHPTFAVMNSSPPNMVLTPQTHFTAGKKFSVMEYDWIQKPANLVIMPDGWSCPKYNKFLLQVGYTYIH